MTKNRFLQTICKLYQSIHWQEISLCASFDRLAISIYDDNRLGEFQKKDNAFKKPTQI